MQLLEKLFNYRIIATRRPAPSKETLRLRLNRCLNTINFAAPNKFSDYSYRSDTSSVLQEKENYVSITAHEIKRDIQRHRAENIASRSRRSFAIDVDKFALLHLSNSGYRARWLTCEPTARIADIGSQIHRQSVRVVEDDGQDRHQEGKAPRIQTV